VRTFSVRPTRPGSTSSGPFSVADDPHRTLVLGSASASGAAEALNPRTATSFFGSKPITSAGSRRSVAGGTTDVERSPATTCAAVTARRGDPAAAGDARPQADPRTRTTLWVTARRLGRRRSGRQQTGESRPAIDGNGSTRASVQQPVGRDDRVQLPEQGRALDVAPERRLPRKQESGRAEDPDEREAGGGPEHEPARAVERP
jgi:hypothetical protein